MIGKSKTDAEDSKIHNWMRKMEKTKDEGLLKLGYKAKGEDRDGGDEWVHYSDCNFFLENSDADWLTSLHTFFNLHTLLFTYIIH